MGAPSWFQRFKAWCTPRHRLWLVIAFGFAVSAGFYFWLTSARILGEVVRTDHAISDPAFADSMGSLLGAEFLEGNAVETYVNGDQFFPAMLADIREARRSITLETYIWASGEVSDRFIEALVERAQAGVKVHVLADGMGTLKLKREDRMRLIEGGVEYHVYGREHWWEVKPNINHRTHRKLLIIDGRVGFTGGMCIDDSWQGSAESEDVWRETQVRVEGPAVRQMQSVFAANWVQTTQHLLFGPEYFPEQRRAGRSRVNCYMSGPGQSQENARIAHLLAIAGARESIRISNAYFIPDDLAVEMLVEATARGVRVEIVAPAINDSKFGRAASRSRWGPLLEAGAELHLYQTAMYHPKVMVIDDVFTTIGSVNFDNRSFGINDEVAVCILDRDVAREHMRIFESDKARSKQWTLADHQARSWPRKATDWFCGLFRSQL